jgi:translocation and assembly module TamB
LVIDVRDASIALLNLHREEDVIPIADVRLTAKTDRVHHEVRLVRAGTPWGIVRSDVRIDGSGPVTLDANASIDGRWLDEPVQLIARVAGALTTLDIQLQVQGQKLSGRADIAATPFARLPFTRANVTVEHLNPQQFSAAAPMPMPRHACPVRFLCATPCRGRSTANCCHLLRRARRFCSSSSANN